MPKAKRKEIKKEIKGTSAKGESSSGGKTSPTSARPVYPAKAGLYGARSALNRAKTTRSYRRVLIVFSVVTLLLIFIITYFSFSKTVITVYPEPKTQAVDFNVIIKNTITETDDPQSTISGRILNQIVSDSLEYPDLKTTKTVEGKASGKVTIYNNWSKEQPLAPTTRLLSEEGILFRTKELLNIPSGQKVETEVEADQVGKSGNISPARFTLPGLWPGLQDKIYAESQEAMSGGIQEVTIVTEEDLENAREKILSQIKEKARLAIEKNLDLQKGEKLLEPAQKFEILTEEFSHEVGTETGVLKVSLTVSVIAPIFNEEELLALAKNSFLREIPSEMEIFQYQTDSLKYSLTQYDLKNQTAELSASFKGNIILKNSHPLLNPSKIINKDRKEIKNYFSNFSEVKLVEVKFSPFWVFRAPALADHIKFKIEK